MTEEKLKEFLLECYKVWLIRRATLTTIGKLLDDEIEEAINSDPRFAAVFRGLLSDVGFGEIEKDAQLNCTVEEYLGLK